jgi:hypothetical protein
MAVQERDRRIRIGKGVTTFAPSVVESAEVELSIPKKSSRGKRG